jgi:multidrug efflux pump subunit AcrA (membrane-fusion protein)
MFTQLPIKQLVSLLLLALLTLTACGAPEVDATPEVNLGIDVAPIVSATGVVVPPRETTVSFPIAGTIVELLVEEGSIVAASDVLARLDTTLLEAEVAEAEAALAIAEANLEKASVGARDEEIEQAEHDLSAATASVSQAAAQRDAIRSDASQAEISAAEADLHAAWMAMRGAEDRYHVAEGTSENTDPDYQELLPEGGLPIDPERVENEAENLDVANRNLAAAQAYLEDLTNGPDESDLKVADAQVWVAAAEREAAEAYLALLHAGPRPENIAVAQARVEQSEAALRSAESALDKAILRAPFDGTISAVYVHANEWANPGQQIALMAGGGDLIVETTDLNEIDVARVEVGDPVVVTFDALPDETIDGTVLSIAPRASEGAGVNYTVQIALEKVPAGLRWGMTAFVDITVE